MRSGGGDAVGCVVCTISGYVSVITDHDVILMSLSASPSFSASVIDALNILSSTKARFSRYYPRL